MSEQVSSSTGTDHRGPERPATGGPDAVTSGPDDGIDGVISRSAEIGAPAAELFALLADPARHAELDGSGTVRGPIGAAGRLYLGRRFTMRMHHVVPYLVPSTVVAFDAGRVLAWRHVAGHVWRWEFTDLGAGRTRVTETFDPRPSPLRAVLARAGAGNAAGIEATLRRLQERFGD